MILFEKLFQKKQKNVAQNTAPKSSATQQPLSFQEKANLKERSGPIARDELMRIFSEYFAPNIEFYSAPGSKKFTAYFEVVNAARNEMFRDIPLFKAATRWTPEQLAELVNNPIPGVTNSLAPLRVDLHHGKLCGHTRCHLLR